MKIYGYKKDLIGINELFELEEITIQTTAENLKKIAEFISTTADIVDEQGSAFGHEHFKDFMKEDAWEGPDIIISK
jgi:hypothetical protein